MPEATVLHSISSMVACKIVDLDVRPAPAVMCMLTKLMFCRFEKSVGPSWPARIATPRGEGLGQAGKENSASMLGDSADQNGKQSSISAEQYLEFTPAGEWLLVGLIGLRGATIKHRLTCLQYAVLA